jgi:hypothetical protein
MGMILVMDHSVLYIGAIDYAISHILSGGWRYKKIEKMKKTICVIL